ncbi:MAG: InlB B-repeat-containing protein [Lachnospiraceae bacterium]|nr:InlB B-repeat-containing protein [Lachnospiraceae bacterium]
MKKATLKRLITAVLSMVMFVGLFVTLGEKAEAKANAVTITFDFCGGTVSQTDSRSKITFTTTSSTITLPSTGYYPGKQLRCWSKEKNSGYDYSTGEVIATPSKNTTYYAFWYNPGLKIMLRPYNGSGENVTVHGSGDGFKAGDLVQKSLLPGATHLTGAYKGYHREFYTTKACTTKVSFPYRIKCDTVFYYKVVLNHGSVNFVVNGQTVLEKSMTTGATLKGYKSSTNLQSIEESLRNSLQGTGKAFVGWTYAGSNSVISDTDKLYVTNDGQQVKLVAMIVEVTK